MTKLQEIFKIIVSNSNKMEEGTKTVKEGTDGEQQVNYLSLIHI